MRALVLLLVVANLGYLAWQYSPQFEDGQVQTAENADGVPRLLLLSEVAAPVAVEEKPTGTQELVVDDGAPVAAEPDAVAEAAADTGSVADAEQDLTPLGETGVEKLVSEATQVPDSPAEERVATLAELAPPQQIDEVPVVGPTSEGPLAQKTRAEELLRPVREEVAVSVGTLTASAEDTTEQDIVETSPPSVAPVGDEAAAQDAASTLDEVSETVSAEPLASPETPAEGEPRDAPPVAMLKTTGPTEIAIAMSPSDLREARPQEPEPLPIPEPLPANAPEVQTAPEAVVCQALGPLPSEEDSLRIQAVLEDRAQRVIQRVIETEEVGSWWVVVPRPAGREARGEFVQGLRESGFKDIWTITRGKLRGNISLGIYGYRPNAQRARDKAVTNGFVANIEPRVTTRSHYWLDIAIAHPAGTPEPIPAILEELGDLPEGASLTPTPCQQIVAAPKSP